MRVSAGLSPYSADLHTQFKKQDFFSPPPEDCWDFQLVYAVQIKLCLSFPLVSL